MKEDKVVHKKVTLREMKAYLTQLMDNYADEMPVLVEVKHGENNEKFDIVPKTFKYQNSKINLKVVTLPIEELETIETPGLYMASSSYTRHKKTLTNYYGLYIDWTKKRDLHFFPTEDKCLEWLNKKIKAIKN